jgi:hypothetical protein
MTQTSPVPRVRIGPEHRAAYIASLASTGSHSAACQAVGIKRNTMWAHIEAHPDFAEQVADAKAAFADSLLSEAKRRAVEGLAGELVLYEGEPVADPERPGEFLRKPHRYSDRLLALMLEKVGPDSFRAPDRVVHEHSGTVRHEVAAQPITREFLSSLPKAAQIEVRKRLINDAFAAKQIDSDKRLSLLADLAVDADEWGIPIQIGELAALPSSQVVDVDFESVEDGTPTLDEINELIPL